SYGPQILQVWPNAGTASGGDTIQIYGYGFGSDVSKVNVKVGGASAIVQKIDLVSALGLPASFPFSLERITLTTPTAVAGKADVSISAPSGSTTATGAFQFLKSIQFFPQNSFRTFIAYDQKRQQLYASAVDHVNTLDLQGHAGILQMPGGPSPVSGLRG